MFKTDVCINTKNTFYKNKEQAMIDVALRCNTGLLQVDEQVCWESLQLTAA